MVNIEGNIRYDRAGRWISVGKKIVPITATRFENALKDITSAKSQKPIIVFLRGRGGGELYPCLKIYGDMRNSEIPIFTVAVDVVFSGFFYILQTGQKRFATQKTKLMFHRTNKFFDNINMNANDLSKERDSLLMFDGTQIKIFCRRGRPVKRVIELFMKEATIYPTEARALKLIDEIIEKDTIKNMCARIRRLASRKKAFC